MKRINASSIFFLSLICASCMSAKDRENTFDAGHTTQKIKMRSGEINQSNYEQEKVIGDYLVLSSKIVAERSILTKITDSRKDIPFGHWSNIQAIQAGEVVELVDILEKITHQAVVIDINKPVVKEDLNSAPDVPKSNRQLFDGRAVAENCIAHFQAGWLPRRVSKKGTTFVFDCMLPSVRDSGYLIYITSDQKIAHVTLAEFYQYDRIPRKH
jgi:hypothetical protein